MPTLLHELRQPIASIDRALPALAKLQGNILKGHGREHLQLLFVRFSKDRAAALDWLRLFASEVTSAASQLVDGVRFRALRFSGPSFKSISLTFEGYEYLGVGAAKEFWETDDRNMRVQPLRQGFLPRRKLLGSYEAGEWQRQYDYMEREPIHALVQVADDTRGALDTALAPLREAVARVGDIVHEEAGYQILNAASRPIEPFGFADGISHPHFFQEDVERDKPSGGFQAWDPSAGPCLVLIRDPLVSDPEACGSYLVFMKLEQKVDRFLQLEDAFAEALGLSSNAADREYAAALLMGRYRDGRPLGPRASAQRNDFDFNADTRYPLVCPVQAHVRKTNPRRNDRVGDDFRMRRIARRSIPYGIPAPSSSSGTAKDIPVGLLFMCYQASITRQFEFIQQSWINDVNFPTRSVGVDPILGHGGPAQHWHSPRIGPIDFSFESVVHERGGAYFFTPSIPFLAGLKP